MSHDEEGADEGEQHAAGFMKRRKAAALQGEPEDDDDRHQVLQYARCCCIAVMYGRKVRVLHAEHTEYAEEEKLLCRKVVPPQREDVASVFRRIEQQQEQPGEHHAHHDEPFGGEASLLQQELRGDAGAAPEERTERHEQNAFFRWIHGIAPCLSYCPLTIAFFPAKEKQGQLGILAKLVQIIG